MPAMTTHRITPTRALTTFAVAQVPLMLIAAALGWRRYALDPEALLANLAFHGSALSGPLSAQLPFLAVAWAASRPGRLGAVATWTVAVAGLLITANGLGSLASVDPVDTPAAALTAGSLGFGAAGLAITLVALRAAAASLQAGRHEAGIVTAGGPRGAGGVRS